MKKRISILLVVTMLVSMFCTFSIASAEGETAKPEVLIYGGQTFNKDAYKMEYFSPRLPKVEMDGQKIEGDYANYIVVNVAMKNFEKAAGLTVWLEYDKNLLVPQKASTTNVWDDDKEDYVPVKGPADAADRDVVLFTPRCVTSAQTVSDIVGSVSYGTAQVFLDKDMLVANVTSNDGFEQDSARIGKYHNIGALVFKIVNGTEADITADSIKLASLDNVHSVDMTARDSLLYTPLAGAGQNIQDTLADGKIDYTIDINGTVLATSKGGAPVEPEQSTEPVEPEQSTEPVEPEQSTEPEAPALSSNAELDSFGQSGIEAINPAEAEGYDYEAKVITAGYQYIWATAADSKATITNKYAATLEELATKEYTAGRSLELERMATGTEKYVAFKITAEDGTAKEYVVKLYRPASSNAELDSFGFSGIEAINPVEAEGYDYEAKVITAGYQYIWATAADSKATITNKYAATLEELATKEYTAGRSLELERMATGTEKYVAFKIIAQNEEEKVYIVKLYREASSDARISSFGTSGIAAPVAVDNQDYDYEVTINTSSYSYIWARPEYAQATVKSAVADSIVDAKDALADGKTVQIDRMTEIGAVKYVAFEITAQNGDKATYIVKVTRQ